MSCLFMLLSCPFLLNSRARTLLSCALQECWHRWRSPLWCNQYNPPHARWHLTIFVDSALSKHLYEGLEGPLLASFSPFLSSVAFSAVDSSSYVPLCHDHLRRQLDGNRLLDVLHQFTTTKRHSPAEEETEEEEPKSKALGLLLTPYDAYSSDLNFVFGVARRGRAAFVTTYRLSDDPDFVRKECVHEVGPRVWPASLPFALRHDVLQQRVGGP
ncbi:hypothetical protein QOT17_009505 [Balamuthia mandrillaris]